MCLLIHHTPQGQFTKSFVNNVYQRNSDGFGAMWGDGKKVHVIKTLDGPKEIAKLYDQVLRGKECVMHFRMRTHGDVDMTNTHPYKVFDDLYMAHNGVLHTGNDHDKSKSDTWHFIEDYIKPMLSRNRDLVFEPSFQRMLGQFIGAGNKFSFVHKSGRVVVVNRSSGVKFREMWLSNTYAWDATRFPDEDGKIAGRHEKLDPYRYTSPMTGRAARFNERYVWH